MRQVFLSHRLPTGDDTEALIRRIARGFEEEGVQVIVDHAQRLGQSLQTAKLRELIAESRISRASGGLCAIFILWSGDWQRAYESGRMDGADRPEDPLFEAIHRALAEEVYKRGLEVALLLPGEGAGAEVPEEFRELPKFDLSKETGLPDAVAWLLAGGEEPSLEEDSASSTELEEDDAGPKVELVPGASDRPIVYDDNVQFTVYRPSEIEPGQWKTFLVFAHLAERAADADPDSPDPLQEVIRIAEGIYRVASADLQTTKADASQSVPREGVLNVVPEITGMRFNPPSAQIVWEESVHHVNFRGRAEANTAGQMLRGKVSIYLGVILLAEITLAVRVAVAGEKVPEKRERSSARPYRKIFASYSHKDLEVVKQWEQYARALGDQYLRDWVHLRAGEKFDQRLKEMIEEADVFQLFWSERSLQSVYCREEWNHAMRLRRENFVRPSYWESPMPQPPDELRELHFQRIPGVSGNKRGEERAASPIKAPQPSGMSSPTDTRSLGSLESPRPFEPQPSYPRKSGFPIRLILILVLLLLLVAGLWYLAEVLRR